MTEVRDGRRDGLFATIIVLQRWRACQSQMGYLFGVNIIYFYNFYLKQGMAQTLINHFASKPSMRIRAFRRLVLWLKLSPGRRVRRHLIRQGSIICCKEYVFPKMVSGLPAKLSGLRSGETCHWSRYRQDSSNAASSSERSCGPTRCDRPTV